MIESVTPKGPEIIITEPLNLTEWAVLGNPHMWKIMETVCVDHNTYEAQVDYGYGYVRLMVNGDEVGRAKVTHIVIFENCVLLDKEYFGCSKYLWFKAIS